MQKMGCFHAKHPMFLLQTVLILGKNNACFFLKGLKSLKIPQKKPFRQASLSAVSIAQRFNI